MTVDRAELDHLVVAAASLDEGRAWCRDVLGVEASTGGSHDGLGTHNVLVSLGSRRYLEVIAIDPDAAPPIGPRWFGLDTEEVRARVAGGPALVTWVARCIGGEDAVERLSRKAGYGPVDVRAASRGALRWRFAFSRTGDLMMGGVLPPLIQWDSDVHPTDRLPDVGLALSRLDLAVPEPAAPGALLTDLALDQQDVHVVRGPTPGVRATLTGADGLPIVLGSLHPQHGQAGRVAIDEGD